eukprot:7378103-Prymnesium_polylepis.1
MKLFDGVSSVKSTPHAALAVNSRSAPTDGRSVITALMVRACDAAHRMPCVPPIFSSDSPSSLAISSKPCRVTHCQLLDVGDSVCDDHSRLAHLFQLGRSAVLRSEHHAGAIEAQTDGRLLPIRVVEKTLEPIELTKARCVTGGDALRIRRAAVVTGRQIELSQVRERIERLAITAEEAQHHCLLLAEAAIIRAIAHPTERRPSREELDHQRIPRTRTHLRHEDASTCLQPRPHSP